jgi:peptidoglycan/xylan/chitin deacetylase (PgdA/CDA1 family)
MGPGARIVSDVLVLCYHGVSRTWPTGLAIDPEVLERQLAGLVAKGYQGATFTQAVLDPPAPRTLAVTFDDAYRSVHELALPVLARLGLPGTVFVPTAFAGTEAPMAWPGIDQWLGTEHERELIPMSWEELRELQAEGWEVGSHTESHPRLPRLEGDALRGELERSRVECEEQLGVPCRSIAYPFGDHSPAVVAAAGAAGYETAGAVAGRVRTPEPLLWPRDALYRHDSVLTFRLKVSPLVRRLRRSHAWRARFLLRRRRPA